MGQENNNVLPQKQYKGVLTEEQHNALGETFEAAVNMVKDHIEKLSEELGQRAMVHVVFEGSTTIVPEKGKALLRLGTLSARYGSPMQAAIAETNRAEDTIQALNPRNRALGKLAKDATHMTMVRMVELNELSEEEIKDALRTPDDEEGADDSTGMLAALLRAMSGGGSGAMLIGGSNDDN